MQMTDQNKRRALGKGLETLLPGTRGAAPTAAPNPTGAREIAVTLIDRNPYQTRTHFDEEKLADLARSIGVSGVIQPILVRPAANGRFQLISGERRWLASQRAGKETIPVILKAVSDEQAMEITIVENLQRADLNPVEQARAFERLSREFNMTQEQMAARTGKDRASVANFMRLLKLPATVLGNVENGQLTMGHAKVLLMLNNHDDMQKIAEQITTRHLSVRHTEELVQRILYPQKAAPKEKPEEVIDPNVREAQEQLQRSLGLKVRIEDRKGKGKVVIEYGTVEDYDRLLEVLGVS
jgi:ParB family chromosome partitioning protein